MQFIVILILRECVVLIMFKDRFDELMKIFHEGAEGKPIDIKKLFSESLALFEELKKELKEASPEERTDLMRMMSDMYREMLQETQKICENSGMSEEQLLAYSENPSNFTREQWQTLQESRMKIHKAGQGLLKALDTFNPPKEVHTHTVQPLHKEKKKSKKSDWKRS
jgi:hypothetical protein